MRWQGRRESENVEDRRGSGGSFGMPINIPLGRGGIGIGGLVALGIISLIFGINPLTLLQDVSGPAPIQGPRGASEDSLKSFVGVVLGDTETTWTDIFAKTGHQYEDPVLVLYSGVVQSGCGNASAAAGPFYCPMDHKLYLDLSFFAELDQRFGAPGDFAQAYVVAHEVGHHVQTLLGLSDKVQAAQASLSKRESNALSVQVELQADCYAGVWAYNANSRNLIEPGDIDEALQAASAVGDDTLQREMQGRVVPDSFTHGTAAQRSHWFKAGYESGDMNVCNTFAQ